MQRFLMCAAILAAVGVVPIGDINLTLAAEERASKEEVPQAPVTKPNDQKPVSSEDLKKEGEQPKKVEKPDPKKSECRPGSLALMGVGC